MAESRSTNITWHASELTRQQRWEALGCRGATVWFTGLSGSGKSTIAAGLEHALLREGSNAYRLDGDNIRYGLNRNLGFSAEDRAENIRRIAEVARLFAEAGTIAITSFISPYRRDRNLARALHEQNGLTFLEIFVDTPLEICEARDPKGLYKKARAGEITGFTGVDDPYEPPDNAELMLKTDEQDIDACIGEVCDLVRARALQMDSRRNP